MAIDTQIKRLDFSKVTLFVMLVLSLVIASVVVKNSRSTKMSKLIDIPGVGVSVSFPIESRWQMQSQEFSYAQNSFNFIAVMPLGATERINLHWQYSLVQGQKEVASAITSRAKLLEGAVVKTEHRTIGSLPATIIEIASESRHLTMLTALIPVRPGHMLSLDLVQNASLTEFSTEVFEKLFDSIKINTPAAIENGIKLVDGFRNDFLRNPSKNLTGSKYYQLKATDGSKLGFSVEGFSTKDSEAELVASGIYYLGKANGFAQQSLLISDKDFSKFKWGTESGTVPSGAQRTTVVEADPNSGIVIVKTTGTRPIALNTSEVMVPDLLFNTFVAEFAANNSGPAYIDVMLPEGRVVPAIISKSNKRPKLGRKGVSFVIEAKFLDSTDSTQTIFLDSQFNVVSAEVVSKMSYTVETVDVEWLFKNYAVWIPQIEKVRGYIDHD